MRAWMQKTALRLEKALQGRNGMDQLGMHVYALGMALVIAGMFDPTGLTNLLGWIAMGYFLFRTLSKRVEKRRAENLRYMQAVQGLSRPLRQRWLRFKARKEYRFFKCKCGATLRVRRGQGVKELICPMCHEHMTRDTK